LKQWAGIYPVILTQKSQFFETLGWYQPSDFNQKSQFFETLGWYQPSVFNPKS
jgi:ribosomal protein S16